MIYFTDSGTFGETSLQHPKGSLFELDLDDDFSIKPILHKRLAYPVGLTISHQGDLLYFCETLQNRVLRVFIGEDGDYITSVFHQFQGRVGPLSIAINKEGLLFVSIFEHQ